jgi:hypothetical protein
MSTLIPSSTNCASLKCSISEWPELPLLSFLNKLEPLSELARPDNKIVYQGKLTNAPSTALEQRPLAQAIRQFNIKKFNLETNVVYIDLTDSQANIIGTGSVYDDRNCQFVLSLVEDLIREFTEGNIGMLGCYQAQYRCYFSGLMKISKVYPLPANRLTSRNR